LVSDRLHRVNVSVAVTERNTTKLPCRYLAAEPIMLIVE